jgi:Flp pilus assembly protein TadB
MSSRHTTAMLRDFALTIGALAFLAGVIWLGVNVEWTRPWLIGWFMAAIVVLPPLLVVFAPNKREQDNG